MKTGERGQALVLVLILMALGTLLVIPSLQLAFASLRAKQANTHVFTEQYARDGCAEFAVWDLLYGTATEELDTEDSEKTTSCLLNGTDVELVIKMRTELGNTSVAGAENNRVRVTKTVVCDDGDADLLYDDDCSAMVTGGGPMSAKYTVTLEQVSPDLGVGIMAVYDELGTGVSCKTTPCVATSPDGTLPEIATLPYTNIVNIGSAQNPIWKWNFSTPVHFTQQGEKKRFEFAVDLPGNNNRRHCNQVFLKMQTAPHEKSGKTAIILVGASPPAACSGGGMSVEKFVDKLLAPPGMTTKFTYIINVQSLDGSTQRVRNVKDVLAQGTSWGTEFKFCAPANPPSGFTCDAPMYKLANDPFDPDTGDFTSTAGFSNLNNPAQTPHATDIRWNLFWDFTNASSPCALPAGCSADGLNLSAAGSAGDVLIIRFQSHVTPEASGSYYNEVFVDTNCSAPSQLVSEGVTTSQEYCASYSWPTGGTLVPMYDVRADAGDTTGQGNVSVGANDASLDSWTVVNQ